MTVTILNPIEVRSAIWRILAQPPEHVSHGLLGAGIGILNEALTQVGERLIQAASGAYGKEKIDLTADNRHAVLGFLFTPDNQPYVDGFFHVLNDHQKYALYRWIKPAKPGDTWLPREGFITEARWILSEALQIRAAYKNARWGNEKPAPHISSYLETLTAKLTEGDLFSQLPDGNMVAEGLRQGGQIAFIVQDEGIVTEPPQVDKPKLAWPKPKSIASSPAPNQNEKIKSGMDYVLARLAKIQGEAAFNDQNAARLIGAYDYLIDCGRDQIEPEQGRVDEFLFCLGQYQRAEG
jgi:hypothetical protein